MKKIFTFILVLNMTFYLNAQLLENSNFNSSINFPATKGDKKEMKLNFINQLQKATSHVNFSSENAKLMATATSAINSEKKVSSSKLLLDSIVSKYINGTKKNKTIYQYDNNGNDTIVLVDNWDSINSQWKTSSKVKTIKDNNGLITLYESYLWIGGIYFGSFKYVNTYTNGKPLTNIDYTWNYLTNNWIYSYKTEYSYDSNQNLITSIEYSWDNNLSAWVNKSKSQVTYGANNKISFETNFRWDSNLSNWVNISKDVHNYNTLGNDTLVLDYSWDSITTTWIIFSKIVYSYSGNNRLAGLEFWNWDNSTNSWIGSLKQEYSFDANGNITLSVISMWENMTSTWKGFQKYTISYLANSNLQQLKITYNWVGNSWMQSTEIESIYDSSNNKSIENMYNWNMVRSTWDKKLISTYYYSSFSSTDVPTVMEPNMFVYPNPVTNELHINGILLPNSEVTLMDISGKVVLRQQSIEKTIQVSSLNEGIYFLQITNKNGTAIYKFIKLPSR